MTNFLTLIVLAFAALGSVSLSTKPADAAPCDRLAFEGSDYIVCSLDLAEKDQLHLFWKDKAGEPYRSFSNLAQALSSEGQALVFAMNAGMYSDAFVPVGLYVEGGRELRPANLAKIETTSGPVPNFYKRPNGVFFVDETGGHVMTTEDFLRQRETNGGRNPQSATQSGPMLVIDNKLHPALIEGSSDRTRRSGVGVCDKGQIRFAISDDDVNFYDFARLFRDRLSCANALFLDGGHGVGLYQPELGRNDRSWHGGYGPILAITEPSQGQ